MPETVGYLVMFTAVGVAFILVNLSVGKLLRPAKMDAEKATIYECGEPTVGSAWVQFDLRFYVVALLFVIFDVEMAFFFPWAVVFGKGNQLADPNLPSEKRAALTADLSTGRFDAEQERAYRQILDMHAAGKFGMTRGGELPGKPPLWIREENAKTLRAAGFDMAKIESSLDLFYLRIADDPKQRELALQNWEYLKKWYEDRVAEGDRANAANLEKHIADRSDNQTWFGDTEPVRITRENIARGRRLAWVAFFDILFFFGVILVGFAYLWRRGDLNWVRSLAAQKEG